MIRRFPVLQAVWLVAIAAASAESIWVEGEDPVETDRQRHGWYDGVRRELLSGGDWLSHYGDAPASASYRIEVEEAGTFAIWARLNPVASKPSWRLDEGAWQAVDFRDARGQQNVAPDDAVDHRFVAWVRLAETALETGAHTIAFRWEGGARNSGALDCLVATSDGFLPQGMLKPGELLEAAAPDAWFPLLPGEDRFAEDSVIDLSGLVPAPAGGLGILQADGKDLRFADSADPVKLWGVGANVEPGRYTPEQMTRRARYLRKFGVNIVRQHPLWDELQTGGRIDPAKLDEYDRWFAILKAHGIHTCWSVFYHFTIGPDDGYPRELYDELEDRGGRKDTYGIVTVSPELWAIRNRVLVDLLQHRNPHTGLRYADDPALAIVEMNNEDSVFFWNPLGWLSEGKRMPLHSMRLRRQWAAWVRERYGTDGRLREAWGDLRAGDSVEADELRLMGPWELPGEGPRGTFAGLDRRAGDTIRFLAGQQRAHYEACRRAIREAGFDGVVVTTAWQVGGAASDAANTWTDCVGDLIDRHNYFGGGAGGHGITEGEVKNGSHLGMPGGGLFSIGMKQVEGKPFSVTEWTQLPPNQWKLEAAPLMAFYGLGLQGWDASFHFAQSGTGLGDGWPRLSSYATDTPHFIGQFPALAIAVHRGHVREAPIVAARRLDEGDLFGGRDALKQDATQGGFDAKTVVDAGGTPAEAFAIGRITVSFEGGESESADLGRWWNDNDRVIRSATGELTWDYGRERVLVATPKTQAILGRPGADPIRLPAVTAQVKTGFVSLIFTPLDDAPLAESRRILVTALARDRQRGARYSEDGSRLEAVGTAPLMLEPVQAIVRLAGPRPAAVRPLDPWGVPTGDAVPVEDDGRFAIDGRFRAYYYEVRR